MRVVRTLGLDAAVEQSGERLRRCYFCDQAGAILFENDLEDLWGDTGPFVGIERMRLRQILVAGIEGIRCRLGTSVRGLTQRGDHVSVVFSDGSLGTYCLPLGLGLRRSGGPCNEDGRYCLTVGPDASSCSASL